MECYLHHVPGRLRVRMPAIRNNAQITSEVEGLFDIYGVDNLKINPLTGSVVIHFDPALVSHDQILQILKTKGLFDESCIVNDDEKIQQASRTAVTKAGRAVMGYAIGKVLEASGFSLLAALI
jgi:copper chaperone CopZ